jgi:class 3 adenylate cyclase/predicted ATPase
MDFDALLAQVCELLQRQGRVSYRTLKVRFNLDDAYLDALKDELIYAQHVALDEEDRVLVWTGGTTPEPARQPSAPLSPETAPAEPRAPEAERRQLTVLFCDLVGSTALASQLDPEEWREVVRAYQDTCAKVIARYEGHIAQYLGDGLLVYFGYPQAHEDDAQRAVRAGLGMVETINTLNTQLERDKGLRLAVRVGIDTGLVVVGGMGGRGRQEQLALGDTPNVAARLQGLAPPNTVLISAATHRLVQGHVTAAEMGSQTLKGFAAPVPVYHVLGAGVAQSRLEVSAPTGWTPLVDRESEVALLLERWAQSQAGLGQVVLLSGEAGIGKSRLVEVLRERLVGEGSPGIVLRCSPYHTHSALYPVIEHLQRWLQFQRNDTPEEKLRKLEEALARIGVQVPCPSIVPLLATLLSVPLPEGRYPPVWLSPPQQRQRTLDALVAWLLAEAERQPVLVVWEDLHWADPSTLEFLSLVIDQVPTARMLTLLTCRPEFRSPWAPRSHLTQLTLGRLGRAQVEVMIEHLTRDKALPAEVVQQVVTKTDGVPLFVEELTKMVLESGWLQEREDHYELVGAAPRLAIPATLHDSLMARLDRLAAAKEVAQLGATVGREFSYEVLRAVAPMDEARLQRALARLVEAELLYPREMPPRASYRFKHALIQEAAYQALLKSTRQQAHQRIAQVLEAQFPQTVEAQPELLAHHYTEAGLSQLAVVYWQRAGKRAMQASAHAEAIAHLTKGLALLHTLPDSPARTQHELTLQIGLGTALMAIKGYAAPEVVQAYARALELCRQVGATPQLFEVLMGLCIFYQGRAEFETARELADELLRLAQSMGDPTLLVWAHNTMGYIVHLVGELRLAQSHLEQSLALYDPQQHRAYGFVFDPGVDGLCMLAQVLQMLGYPDQARKRSQEALALARELAHPFSLTAALREAATVHRWRGEQQLAQALQEEGVTLCREQGFSQELAQGMVLHGRDLVRQGQGEAGIAQMRQGLAALRATGTETELPWLLSMLAAACGNSGRAEEGLRLVDEALAMVHRTGKRLDEAGLYRLKGELLLKSRSESLAPGGQSLESEIEGCFRQALEVARHQQAKSFELRAAMSLSRLWQQQGKRHEAYELLAPIYGWFTEGFDTADLQEAKALLEALA